MPTLLPEVEQSLHELASRTSAVEVLLLFGSAARSRLTHHSDLDLYVRLTHGAPFDSEEFREEAERICRRDIDLVVECPTTSVILRREVAAKGRVLFEKRPGVARQFVVDAVRDYVDLEPYLSRIGAAIRARAIAEGVAAKKRLAQSSAKGRDDGG